VSHEHKIERAQSCRTHLHHLPEQRPLARTPRSNEKNFLDWHVSCAVSTLQFVDLARRFHLGSQNSPLPLLCALPAIDTQANARAQI
jgi:hypothetical protein